MEFGWGFIALFVVIFLGCGRMCGWGPRRRRHHREVEGQEDEGERRLSSLESRLKGLDRGDRRVREAVYDGDRDGAREPVRARSNRSSALEELQKRFIDGRITVDEYERELDRLEKIE